MPVRITPSPDRLGEWRVSLDDTHIVCFSGPSAHEQAVRRSIELATLLDEPAAPADSLAGDPLARPNSTDE